VPHFGQAFMGLYSSKATIFPESLPITLTSTDPFAYKGHRCQKSRLPHRGRPNTLPVNGCIVPSGSITHQKYAVPRQQDDGDVQPRIPGTVDSPQLCVSLRVS
jgi:hypothetical protein